MSSVPALQSPLLLRCLLTPFCTQTQVQFIDFNVYSSTHLFYKACWRRRSTENITQGTHRGISNDEKLILSVFFFNISISGEPQFPLRSSRGWPMMRSKRFDFTIQALVAMDNLLLEKKKLNTWVNNREEGEWKGCFSPPRLKIIF